MTETSACVFCAIVRGAATPGVIAYRDSNTAVFPSLHQRVRNRAHMLVVPAAHVPDIYALDPLLGGALMATVADVARALKRVWHADGVSVRQNNEPAGGQDVFHVHFHVVPRFANDGFDVGEDRFPFGAIEVSLDERLAQSVRLRAALEAE
jgi:histidine triad (HIT) family protein